MHVEDDHDSDCDGEYSEDHADHDSQSPLSPLLSPSSKRAKKRQAAARNKRLAKEAKLAAGKTTDAIGSNKDEPGLSSSTVITGNGHANPASGPSSLKELPQLQPVDLEQSRPAALAQEASIPILISSPEVSTASARPTSNGTHAEPAKLAPRPSQSRRTTTATNDEEMSMLSTEDEDVSLLIDGDEDSSSSAGEGSVAARIFEPDTPKAERQRPAGVAAAMRAGLQQNAGEALSSIMQSDVVPGSISQSAERIKESSVVKEGQTGKQNYGTDHDPTKKWKAIMTRTIWTLIMILGFAGGRTAINVGSVRWA